MSGQINPDKEIYEYIKKNELLSILQEFEEQIGEQVYELLIFVDDKFISCECINSKGGNMPRGEVTNSLRCRFKPTFNQKKVNYQIEAIYDKSVSPEGTGFSGFRAVGLLEKESQSIIKNTCTTQFNIWEWRGWI